ncbi:hypothetical protein ACFQAT_27595 [Undibacterium arcticum]|uniref:hypothetical protein n=1 Tax=Undibacterium arcticum TaxID=1762892 RepID=UPI00361BFE02
MPPVLVNASFRVLSKNHVYSMFCGRRLASSLGRPTRKRSCMPDDTRGYALNGRPRLRSGEFAHAGKLMARKRKTTLRLFASDLSANLLRKLRIVKIKEMRRFGWVFHCLSLRPQLRSCHSARGFTWYRRFGLLFGLGQQAGAIRMLVRAADIHQGHQCCYRCQGTERNRATSLQRQRTLLHPYIRI